MTGNTQKKTRKNSKRRISPALVISCVALFCTLAGTALAQPVNSIFSRHIVDGTIRTVDLKDDAVKNAKIADDAVNTPEIADAAVTSAEVADDSLTASDLGAASVGSSEVVDQSLNSSDLGPASVGTSELQAGSVRSAELAPLLQFTNTANVANGAVVSVTATCPAGTTVISGGAQPANFGVELTSTKRNGNGWLAQAKNNSGGASSLTAYAYCLAA